LENFIKFTPTRNLVGVTGYHVRELNELTDANLTHFKEVLRRAQDLTAGWVGRLVFVYLPDFLNFALQPSPRRDSVLRIVEELDIPIVDFEARLMQTGRPLDYFVGHYNAKGYRLLANQIHLEAFGASSGTID